MLKVYLARAMSNRDKATLVKEAKADRKTLKKFGIVPFCPVGAEGVKNEKGTLLATKKQMDSFWFRDKQMIRNANVVFDMTPGMKSEGVAHELAYARYFLWKPVVRVYPYGELPPVSSVAYYEDDVLTGSLDEACLISQRRWGTWYKRFWWRIRLLVRCLPKAIRYQIGEWK